MADDDDDDDGPFWHPLLLGEICVAAGFFLFLRLTACTEDACAGRRVAFYFVGLPLFALGMFFTLVSFMTARTSCLVVMGVCLFLALFVVVVALPS